MDNFESIKKELIKLGLSEKEASIYLFLVTHKELRIQEIVRLTHIPRSSVYECLKNLEDLGLVETIIDNKFTIIKAYKISSVKHKLNEELTNLQERLSSLVNLENTIKLLPDEISASTIVRYYKGISGARQLFWNTLKASDRIYVYSAFGRSKFVGKNFYMDFVEESSKAGIKEKVLINPTEHALGLIKRDNGSPIARTKVNDLRFLEKKNLLIEGETFIYNNIFAQVKLDGLEISGFEIESISFIKMQRSIFKTLWRLAKPISSIL